MLKGDPKGGQRTRIRHDLKGAMLDGSIYVNRGRLVRVGVKERRLKETSGSRTNCATAPSNMVGPEGLEPSTRGL